jgi:hypothetical protein
LRNNSDACNNLNESTIEFQHIRLLGFPALVSAHAAPLVFLIQDIVSVISMPFFLIFTTSLLVRVGVDHITKPATSCPKLTPPLCCLLPCTKPAVTKKIVPLILFVVKLFSFVLLVNLLINVHLIFYPNDDISDIYEFQNFLLLYLLHVHTQSIHISLLFFVETERNTLNTAFVANKIYIVFLFCFSCLFY